MTTFEELLQSIEDAPNGQRVGAFFDFDGTVIAGYSVFPFLHEQFKSGRLNASELLEILGVTAKFGRGRIDFTTLLETSASLLKGQSVKGYNTFGEEVFEKRIARLIYPEARQLIEAHFAKGHTVAIVSSATPYQIEPAARDLGIEHVLCSRLGERHGRFTGTLDGDPCWGEGKVDAARALGKTKRIAFKNSFFYSDGYEDIPLLEKVGNPRVLNPGSKLEDVAEENDWPVQKWKSRGHTNPGDFLRSVAATYSLIPSFSAALPVWALTGSKQQALNYSLGLFAETASALIRLNLNVTGEHHLWEHRPAVFIFNHQSKADVVILAKLIRQDLAGVGKQEIKNMPVIGKIFELGGVVMIDRKNSASAIEAMQPLVDVMRDEGKSVCLAPEGTRSVTPKLGKFKKGAFHLAIQAGVPMVPIVIQNALDVAPKGEFVFRPATVDVEVLPPVDTSSWTAETVNDHVAEVRGMFLRALGQDEPAAKSAPKKPAANGVARNGRSKKTGEHAEQNETSDISQDSES